MSLRHTDDIDAAFDELEELLRQLQWAAKAMEEDRQVRPVLSARVSSARTVTQLLRRGLLSA